MASKNRMLFSRSVKMGFFFILMISLQFQK